MENIIKKRIENFKTTRDCFENTKTTFKIYDAKIELLESILEEAREGNI